MQAPSTMRRGFAPALIALAMALPGEAQTPGPRLHRFIPGDLNLGEFPPGVLAAPNSADEFRRATSGTGWSDRQDPNASVLHPRNNWNPNTRGMDLETRSPAGATLRYTEVFSPSIAPFKRTHAYDAVDDMGRLTVRDPSLRPLRVGEVPASWSRERVARFTGDVQVELTGGSPTPVPSVAGDEAVLSFRTEPEVAVGFFRDSAGNLFVRAETARTVHLSYVLAAPQYAFVAPDGSVPNDLPGSSALRGPEPEPAAPPFLVTQHPRVLARVGARRDQPFSVTLASLIRYFRAYRDADLPASGETSQYLRLALGGVGACRHRAYAFVLTLHALGVPARYVGNEAHAWAEVFLTGTGWTRVDLGGWDVNLRDDSATRERFVPENADPFPRPAGYANGYSTYGASAPPDGSQRRGHHPEGPQNQGLGPDHDPATQPQSANGQNPNGQNPNGQPGGGAAIAEFEEAHRILPNANVLFNIARAYADAGDLDRAIDYYTRYLAADVPDRAEVERRCATWSDAARAQRRPRLHAATDADAARDRDADDRPRPRRRWARAEQVAALRNAAQTILQLTQGGAPTPPPTPTPPAPPPTPTPPPPPTPAARRADGSDDAYEERLVTATLRAQSPLDSPNASTVITAQDIRLSGITAVPELLRRAVGVDVMALDAGDVQVGIRGFNRRLNNRVLVLVDGRSIYLDFIGLTLWPVLPAPHRGDRAHRGHPRPGLGASTAPTRTPASSTSSRARPVRAAARPPSAGATAAASAR